MNRKILLVAATLGLVGAQAMAQDLPEIEDTDGNGLWSLVELQTVYPTLTEEAFLTIDANADGGVDVAELTAAMADNLLPPTEG
ncbi:MAG TPA: EF-hand domain-containing protein [Paracoccaceae bacterium]